MAHLNIILFSKDPKSQILSLAMGPLHSYTSGGHATAIVDCVIYMYAQFAEQWNIHIF